MLDIPDLKIRGGQVTAILGANGAGKSSLLKVLAGQWEADKGEVLLFGLPLKEWSPKALARARAMLSQNYTMPFALTVKEMIKLGFHPHAPKAAHEAKLQHYIDLLELNPFLDRNVQTLSGGEQQRAHMARVLLQLEDGDDDNRDAKPRLLLLDEPLASLDILHQQLILDAARKAADKGYTVLMVIHDINLALQSADRFILMKQGRILHHAGSIPDDIWPEIFGVPMTRIEDPRTRRAYFFAAREWNEERHYALARNS